MKNLEKRGPEDCWEKERCISLNLKERVPIEDDREIWARKTCNPIPYTSPGILNGLLSYVTCLLLLFLGGDERLMSGGCILRGAGSEGAGG